MNFTDNIATEQRKSLELSKLSRRLDDEALCFISKSSELHSRFSVSSTYSNQNFHHQDVNNLFSLPQHCIRSRNYLYICFSNDILRSRTKMLLCVLVIFVLNYIHKSILWCLPQFLSYGLRDGSTYNKLRFISKLKTTMNVLGCFINSFIANFLLSAENAFCYYPLAIFLLWNSDLNMCQNSSFNFVS